MFQYIYKDAHVARDALHAELRKSNARPTLDEYTELFARHLEQLIVEGVADRAVELPSDSTLTKYRLGYLKSPYNPQRPRKGPYLLVNHRYIKLYKRKTRLNLRVFSRSQAK